MYFETQAKERKTKPRQSSGTPRADSVLGQQSSQHHPKLEAGADVPTPCWPGPRGTQSRGTQCKNRSSCLGFTLLLQQLNVLQNHNLLASCLLLGEVVQIEPWQTTRKDILPYLVLAHTGLRWLLQHGDLQQHLRAQVKGQGAPAGGHRTKSLYPSPWVRTTSTTLRKRNKLSKTGSRGKGTEPWDPQAPA